MARITSVVACDPEFPPLLMMSGIKSARTTARSISAEKNPIAVAVSISPTNRIASQLSAFAHHLRKSHFEIRPVERFWYHRS